MIPAKYWSPTKKLMLLGAMAGGKAVEDTATGNPLIFSTDLARPLKSLLIPFTPQQSGTGDPSPSNIRSILPWNGLSVFGGGKNLFNKEDAIPDKYISGIGAIINSPYGQSVTGWIPVKEGEKIVANSGLNGNYISAFYSEKDTSSFIENRTGSQFPFTVPSGAKYIRLTFIKADTDTYQVEVGSTATAYEPYHPITETDISFPSAVYGGEHEAVSGKLMDGWEVKVYDGSPDESWYLREDQTYGDTFYTEINGKKEGRGKSVCDAFANITDCWGASGQGEYGVFSDHPSLPWTFFRPPNNSVTTLNEWKAWLAENPIHCAYELATPQEIQLTPAQITALLGQNTIWSDADGSMTAVYLKKA